MRIKLDSLNPFNIEATLCCGQAFRWNKQAQWWYGVVGETVFKAQQTDEALEVENADLNFAKNYFGLRDDLNEIFSQICKDKHIKQAVRMFKGLRILRQNPWECLISYICATYKNIAAIKRMILNLSCRFGSEACLDGCAFYTFPTPRKLAQASTSELAECGLGYRAKYVQATARIVDQDLFDFERLRKAKYEEAKAQLLDFPGVGPKAADCILLFSLDKLGSFPVDVRIRRAILRYYAGHFSKEFTAKVTERGSLTNSEYEKLSLFGREYFGEFAGYAQEYLYHFEGKTKQPLSVAPQENR